jgi:hypothetical protein
MDIAHEHEYGNADLARKNLVSDIGLLRNRNRRLFLVDIVSPISD